MRARILTIAVFAFVFCRAAGGGEADRPTPPGDSAQAAMAERMAFDVLYAGIVRWDNDAMRNLSRALPRMSDSVAVQALWLAASAPPQADSTQLYAGALGSASPIVRSHAAAILAGRGTADAMRLVMNSLISEADPDAARRIIDSLANRPSRNAVRTLMEVMHLTGVRPEVTAAAAERLRRLTRARLSDNPSQWRDWWLDNSHFYD